MSNHTSAEIFRLSNWPLVDKLPYNRHSRLPASRASANMQPQQPQMMVAMPPGAQYVVVRAKVSHAFRLPRRVSRHC
jgi:hypothetical protein